MLFLLSSLNLRIGIDAHHLEGERTGVGRYLLNILRLFPKKAAEADRFFLYFKDEIADIPELKQDPFIPRLLKRVWGRKSMALFTHAALPYAAEKDAVDVLWCPGYIGPLRFRGKIALTLHDIIFESRPELYNWPSLVDRILLKWVARKTAERAQRIFVPSQFTKKEVLRLYRIPESRVIVVPLGIDADFLHVVPEEIVKEAKDRYGLTGRYFLFYGSIFTRRRIPECLEAFSRVARKIPDIEFLLGGRDYTGSSLRLSLEIRKLNKTLGREAIRWVMHIPSRDLPALIKGTQALVWISEYEGFGLPVLEALAAGAPVITARTSSLQEVAGECALYIGDPRSIEEIRSAMDRILYDAAFQHTLCICGEGRARQFDWGKTAEKTIIALRECALQ